MWGAIAAIAAPIIANLIQGDQNRQQQGDINSQNYQAQKEFAQMGLQWKVADAKAAGLHPLAALGGAGASFSPSFQAGQSNSDYSGIGEGISQLINGQNTKRAEAATKTDTEKQLEQLSLERAQLQNRLLEGQVQNEWASLMGQPGQPSFPTVGAQSPSVSNSRSPVPRAAPSGSIQSSPSKSISAVTGDKGLEAARTPGYKTYDITPGQSVELPTSEMAESLESMGVAGHVLGPVLGAIRGTGKLMDYKGTRPSDKLLPPGYRWDFNYITGSWSAVRK